MGRRIAVAGVVLALALSGAPVGAVTEDEALVKARLAVNELMDTLREQLNGNVKERGAAASLSQCYYQALTLGKEVENTSGVRVKRTSARLRNPRNAPDAFEKESLARFERWHKEGSMPSEEMRRESIDGKAVFRYVRPITVGAGCLPCHGAPASLSDEVKRALEDRYPEDRATGYAEGDLRGIVSAVVPAE